MLAGAQETLQSPVSYDVARLNAREMDDLEGLGWL